VVALQPLIRFIVSSLAEIGSPSALRAIEGGKFAQLLKAQELGTPMNTLAFD
jgi:hypothetical protein